MAPGDPQEAFRRPFWARWPEMAPGLLATVLDQFGTASSVLGDLCKNVDFVCKIEFLESNNCLS